MPEVWKNPAFEKKATPKAVKSDECPYCHLRGNSHKLNCKIAARKLLQGVKN
jgi:hypothetical protein